MLRLKPNLPEKAIAGDQIPFCYTLLSATVPTSLCIRCGSDDLMRHLPCIGVEYGTEWVIEHMVQDLESVDTEEAFKDMVVEVYGKTDTVGPLEFDVVETLKEKDPDWWSEAKWEYIDDLVENAEIAEIGNKYYWASDLEDL